MHHDMNALRHSGMVFRRVSATSKLPADKIHLLRVACRDSKALKKFVFAGKGATPVTMNVTMTEADFSNKKLGPAGAQILAAFIEREFFQDNGALAKLDISGNDIGAKQQAKIRQICSKKLIACQL